MCSKRTMPMLRNTEEGWDERHSNSKTTYFAEGREGVWSWKSRHFVVFCLLHSRSPVLEDWAPSCLFLNGPNSNLPLQFLSNMSKKLSSSGNSFLSFPGQTQLALQELLLLCPHYNLVSCSLSWFEGLSHQNTNNHVCPWMLTAKRALYLAYADGSGRKRNGHLAAGGGLELLKERYGSF